METSSGCGNPSGGEEKKKDSFRGVVSGENEKVVMGGVELALEHRSPLRGGREPES